MKYKWTIYIIDLLNYLFYLYPNAMNVDAVATADVAAVRSSCIRMIATRYGNVSSPLSVVQS
jgi:hypothetical protein